jgi:hypothetical protein
MSEIKIEIASPDPVLQRASYADTATARIAHVNEAVRLMKAAVSTVGPLSASTNLTGTTVATLRAEVEVRLDNIETKLNAIIASLS